MIYVTALLGVILIELTRYSQRQKDYPNLDVWVDDRWDNLAISFLGAAILCMVFGEVAQPISEFIGFDITNSPKFAGLLIGLGNTPIINFLKKKIEAKTK